MVKNEHIFLALLLLTFVSFLAMPPLIFFLGICGPYLALGLIRETGMKPSPSYFVLAAALVAGGYLLSALVSLYFLCAILLPALILTLLAAQRPKHPWLGLMLASLPVLVLVTVFILYPGNRELYTGIITDAFSALLSQMKEQYTAAGTQVPEKLLYLMQNTEAWANSMVKLFPAMIFCMTALLLFLTEKVFYRIATEDIMELPDFLLALLILGGFCVVLPKESLTFPGYNMLLIAGIFYFFRGFDITRYHMVRIKMHPLARGLFYFLFLSQRFFMLSIAVVGFISIYKDLIRKPKNDAQQV
jgi:hypothetical protein